MVRQKAKRGKRNNNLLLSVIVVVIVVLIILALTGTFTGNATAQEKQFISYLGDRLDLDPSLALSPEVSLNDLLDESGRYSLGTYDFDWFDGLMVFLQEKGWKLRLTNIGDVAGNQDLRDRFEKDLESYIRLYPKP